MINFDKIDEKRFLYACEVVSRNPVSIGTYNEHSLHAVMKYYIEPDKTFHEVPVGRYVADICTGEEICEVQTGKVYAMRDKLTHFLEHSRVTLVVPQALRRHIMLCNPEGGEALSIRKSPRHGYIQEAAASLAPLIDFLENPDFAVWVPLLHVTDVRPCRQGRGRREKKTDTLPRALLGGIYIRKPEDMLAFLPENLPDGFLTSDVAAFAPCPLTFAQALMTMLFKLGLVERQREGRSYRYHMPK